MLPDDLSFEGEIRRKRLLLYGSSETKKLDDYTVREAAQYHASVILNALQYAYLEAISISEKLTNERSRYYLKFGAARRMEMIWFAWRHITLTVPTTRIKPLNSDESRRLTQHMNTIYVNLSGALDNFAWTLMHEFAEGKLTQLKEIQVGLFSPCILQEIRLIKIISRLREHINWDIEVKARRHPSVHRIPLRVPPQIVDSREAEIYSDLSIKTWQAIGRGNVEEAQRLMSQQEEIGRFVPWFLHDPAEPPIPIYPTVSEDLRHLVEIFQIVKNFIMSPDLA
jgi:hypothetical protein